MHPRGVPLELAELAAPPAPPIEPPWSWGKVLELQLRPNKKDDVRTAT
jgi:hypothetical protein